MSSEAPAKLTRTITIWMIVIAVPGFIVTFVLNAFFLDDYDAYGEVPVPGSASLHLPAGQVAISLHTVIIGGPNGGGLPLPPLGVTVAPPTRAPAPPRAAPPPPPRRWASRSTRQAALHSRR